LYGGSRLLAAQRYLEQHPQDVTADEAEFLKASAARELVRERARYLGQAAGGALGTAFGLALALGFGDWSRSNFSSVGRVLLLALVTVLVTLPVGQLVGFSVGLGLWRWRNNPQHRMFATTLIGGLTGTLVFLLFALISARVGAGLPLQQIAAGTIFGAAIGLSVGLPATGWRRVGLVVGSCVAAAVLNVALGTIEWALWVALLAGLLLGGCTSLGFLMTAVDHTEQLIE
jgi:hypothetical protein